MGTQGFQCLRAGGGVANLLVDVAKFNPSFCGGTVLTLFQIVDFLTFIGLLILLYIETYIIIFKYIVNTINLKN